MTVKSFRNAPLTARAVAALAVLASLAPVPARGSWTAARAILALAMPPRLEASLPGPLPLFPPTHWWNTDVSAAPVDPGSDDFIDYVNDGDPQPLHPDFGGTLPNGISIYGFPYIVVDGSQAKKTVQFDQADESDGVDHSTETSFPFYPIPDEAITQPHWVEGGAPGNVDQTCCQDRHMLILDRDNRHLYELYNVWFDGAEWQAYSGAFFDMNTNDRRPEGWTSADAAGLAILPGLVRYDEVYGAETGEIEHAFRFTVRHTNGYVYPGSHLAGLQDPPALPMGARLRLKPGTDISGFDPAIQKIFRAMKRYGLIVADNGTDMYVSGTWDERWDNDILNPAFEALTASRLRGHRARLEASARAGARGRSARGWRFGPERHSRAGRDRDHRAVVGERGGLRRRARGRSHGVHRTSRRELHARRCRRGLRSSSVGLPRKLLRCGRRLLPGDRVGSGRASVAALGRVGDRDHQRRGGEDLDAARRRELRRTCRKRTASTRRSRTSSITASPRAAASRATAPAPRSRARRWPSSS